MRLFIGLAILFVAFCTYKFFTTPLERPPIVRPADPRDK